MNPTFECEITIADFNAFSRFHKGYVFKNANGYVLMVAIAIPFGIGGGLVTGKTELGNGGPLPLMLSFVAGVSFLYITAIVYAQILRKRLQPTLDGYMLGHQKYELRPDGFYVQTKKHEALFRWDCLAKPINHRDYYFVMVERSAAFIIPKRCFASEAEGIAFAEKIEALAQHSPY